MLVLIFVAVVVIGCIRLSNEKLNTYFLALLLGTNRASTLAADGQQLSNHSNISELHNHSLIYYFLGLILLISGYTLIEYIDPYYFVQDDALVTELPGLIYFCRSIFNGQLPEYNPYILLGAPGWSSGGGGTYPFLYVAYLLSVLFFNTEYCTLDVLAFMHMLAGYVAMILLTRRIGLSPPLAILSTLSFLLSGSILITGRCWHAFHALSFYLPAIFLGVHEFGFGKFSWRWVVVQGILIGLLYHAGFPQAWMLTMLLAGIAALILVVTLKLPISHSCKLIPMLMIGASIVYPLFYQQSILAKDLVMQSGYGGGLEHQILAILLPFPLVSSLIPNGWGSTFYEYGGHFSYFGTILAVGACAANLLLLSTWAGKKQSNLYAKHVWTICCLVSFLLTMGESGFLWFAIKALPAGMSNHPFRCYSMFVFFATLSGGLFFQHLFLEKKQARLIFNLIAGAGLCLVLYHLHFVRAAFYNYGFRPFPQLSETIKNRVKGDPVGLHRIVCYSPDRSIDPYFPYALPLSLPQLYEIPALHGYDPLTENKAPFRLAKELLMKNPVTALQEYGVKWALIHQRGLRLQSMLHEGKLTHETPYLSPMAKYTIQYLGAIPYELVPTFYIPSLQALINHYTREKINFIEYKLPETEGNVSLIELKQARPLAFIADTDNQPVQITFRADGLDLTLPIDATKNSQQLVINFLLYPQHVLIADGQELPLKVDDWGRITARVPKNTSSLSLRYATPWGKSIIIASAILLFAVTALYYIEPRKIHTVKNS